jgi:hypothetical protein
LDYNGPSSFNSAITARYLDGQTPPPPPPQQLSNLPPPLSTVKLPSPESLRNPVAPVPVRRHSMADLFRWSVDQCSDKPSGNFLFYSSSLARSLERVDGDEGNDDSNETIADITAPSSLISRPLTEIFPSKATTVYNTSKPNTPDPFSPFPEDYFDDLNESTEFANNKNNSSNSVGPLQTEKADESSEESFCFDPANDMSFGVEEPTRNNFSPLSRPTTMEEFDLGQPSQHSAALRCQLCHNEVMAKGKFGIMVCEHIFCLSW